jgi:hypothetical protein
LGCELGHNFAAPLRSFAKHHSQESQIELIEKPFTRHGLLTKVRAALTA